MYNKGYRPISDKDESIYGYNPPAAKKTEYEDSNIYYTDTVGNEVTIKSQHIPALLRELREKKDKSWPFSSIFVYKSWSVPPVHISMKGLQKFEESLHTSPSTALMDYWLLRMGGHIRTLQGKNGANDSDAQYLSGLYDDLVKKLQNYEKEIGKLAINPSRHQNEERQKLVSKFQTEWQEAIQPAQQKYQQKDINNILKNVAAACSIIGLIWLFCKNLYRLTQGKGLGLFQFENAHSRKLEHLQKLYSDIEKATAKDAEKRENYFSHDIGDAQTTCAELMQITKQLENLPEPSDRKEKKEKAIIINAYNTVLKLFSDELVKIQKDIEAPDAEISLLEEQKDFMNEWQKTGYAQGLALKIGDQSPYSEDYQALFQKIIDISSVFAKEYEHVTSELERRQKPRSSSTSSESSF